MGRSSFEILDDDEEADIAGFMLKACGIDSPDFYRNERVLTRENFEKHPFDKAKFKSYKEEKLDIIKNELLDKNLKPDETLEIVQIIKDILDKTEENGIVWLMDNIEENIEELISVRSNEEKNRGRDETRSPLPWWKWLLVFATCGVGVFVGCWCVVVYYCTYLLEIAIGTSAVVETIIREGC